MDIFREIVNAIEAGDRLALATIISSSGSTPVPPGAKMLVLEHAPIPLGTIGGGCVEADVQDAARRLLASGQKSLIRRFTLTEDDIESGMLCGGTIDILIEILSSDARDLFSSLVSRRESGEDSLLITRIDPHQSVGGKFLLPRPSSSSYDQQLQALHRAVGTLADSFERVVSGAVDRQSVERLSHGGGELIIEPVIGVQDLIIFGGGHVSKYVSRSAAMAGFRVTVVDDRPEYANGQRFPEAYKTLVVGFDDSWAQLQIRPSTSIVIVTRGHKFDERVLERAVRTDARYLGMIGSRRKVMVTFANLVSRGCPRELLKNVRAPIGLDIGALTAEEIGISITAELIAARRGVVSRTGSLSDRVAGFFEADGQSQTRS